MRFPVCIRKKIYFSTIRRYKIIFNDTWYNFYYQMEYYINYNASSNALFHYLFMQSCKYFFHSTFYNYSLLYSHYLVQCKKNSYAVIYNSLPSLEYPTLKHLSLPSSAKIFLKLLIINKAEWSITKLEKSDSSFIIIFRVALSKILSPFNILITWNSKEWFEAYASILGAYRVMNQNVKTYGSTLTHISKNSRYFHVHYIP